MSWLRDLAADTRFAVRLHRRSPTFTAAVVTSLALGIGANTALFTLTDALLLRPLPVRWPQRLVQLDRRGPGGAGPVTSYAGYRTVRDACAGTADVLASGQIWHWNLGVGGAPTERISGELVSGNYFSALGVAALAGRLLTLGDERGDQPVVVLSHGFWTRRFGADPRVLGRTVTLNGSSFTVIGVAGAPFSGLEVADPVDLWAPLGMQPRVLASDSSWLDQPGNNWLRMLARLGPGITTGQAEAVADSAFRQFTRSRGIRDERVVASDGRWGLSPLRQRLGRAMSLLAGLVGLVLLIACVNVATLQLSRATQRERELAVRLALGGGRGRLARQLLTESLLLALGGALVGLLLARLTLDALVPLLFPGADPAGIGVGVHPRVLAFTAVLAGLTALVSGLLPAWRTRQLEPGAGLRGGGGRTSTTAGSWGLTLPAAQVALTFVLLVGAGLFARSLSSLRALDPGFDRSHVLTVRVDAQAAPYSASEFAALYRRLLDLPRSLPGVREVGLADQGLFSRAGNRQRNISIAGIEVVPGADFNPYALSVSPGFFASLGMPLVGGRDLDASDLARGATAVAVVNRSFARHYFGSPSAAIGRRFGFGGPRAASDVLIVGVVEDARQSDLREPVPHVVYTPLGPESFPTRAFSYTETTLSIRTAADPTPLADGVRRLLAASDPRLPVIGMATLEQQVERSLGQDRLASALTLLFAALALALTSTGVYGVLSYAVTRRRREIGVRLALGAHPRRVLWMIGRRGALVLGCGLLVGLPAALAAATFARHVLYGVSPGDPLALAAAVLTVALVTALATLGPARAAVRVDPMVALRSE
jgi:putative ABC transport system permease protein